MHKLQIENLARRWRDLVGSWTASFDDLKAAERVASDTLTALPVLRKYGMPLHFVNKAAAVMEISALGLFASTLEDVPSIFNNCCFLCDGMAAIDAKAAKAPTWPQVVGSMAAKEVRAIFNEMATTGNVQASIAVGQNSAFTLTIEDKSQTKGLRYKLDELVKRVRSALYTMNAIKSSWAAFLPVCDEVMMLAIYDADRATFVAAFYDAAGRLTELKTAAGKKIAGNYLASIHTGVVGYQVQTLKEVMP